MSTSAKTKMERYTMETFRFSRSVRVNVHQTGYLEPTFSLSFCEIDSEKTLVVDGLTVDNLQDLSKKILLQDDLTTENKKPTDSKEEKIFSYLAKESGKVVELGKKEDRE